MDFYCFYSCKQSLLTFSVHKNMGGFVLCFFASTPNNVFLTLQLARQPYKSYNAKSKQLRTSKYKLQQDQWGEGAKKRKKWNYMHKCEQ